MLAKLGGGGALTSRSEVMRTPKRIRCRLGLGTSAARRCMNFSGDITMCSVPSRQGVFSFQHHLSGGVSLHALVGQCRTGQRQHLEQWDGRPDP